MMGLTNIPGGGSSGLSGYASGTVTYTSEGVTFVSGSSGVITGFTVSGLSDKPKVVVISLSGNASTNLLKLLSWVRQSDDTNVVIATIMSSSGYAATPTGSTYTMIEDGFTFTGNASSIPFIALTSSTALTWSAWW